MSLPLEDAWNALDTPIYVASPDYQWVPPKQSDPPKPSAGAQLRYYDTDPQIGPAWLMVETGPSYSLVAAATVDGWIETGQIQHLSHR